MDAASYGLLASSAFRIYLTYVVHESEEALKSYQMKLRFVTPAQKSKWNSVVSAAHRVIKYAKKCKSDETMSVVSIRCVYGLCVIAAAQDCLASCVANAERFHLGSPSRCKYLEYLTEEQQLRVSCIVHCIVSLDFYDQELTTLWEQATNHVLQKCEARRKNGIERQYLPTDLTEIQALLESASLLHKSKVEEKCVEVREMQRRAARNLRLHAVHLVLGTRSVYSYAASIYESASEMYQEAAKTSSVAEKFWSAAGSSLRLVAEMIEAQALLSDSLASEESKIKTIISQAEALAFDAHEVESIAQELEEMEEKHMQGLGFISKCKVSCVQCVEKPLTDAKSVMCHLWERYTALLLEGDRSAAVGELLEEFHSAKAKLSTIVCAVAELRGRIDIEDYYRSRSDACTHIAHDRLRALWQQCWNRAADLTLGEVHLGAQLLLEGESHALVNKAQQKANRLKAELYASYAVDTVSVGVEYANRARGAVVTVPTVPAGVTEEVVEVLGAGRDLREAQWWRLAADYQIQAAGKCMAAIRRLANGNYSEDQISYYLYGSMKEVLQEATALATAADYLSRSFKICTQNSQYPNAQRVSELYAQAAELLFAKSNGECSLTQMYHVAVQFCLALVDVLTGNRANVCEQRIALLQKACHYAQRIHETASICNESANNWQKAFNACMQASALSEDGWNDQASLAVASGVLYARGAVNYDQICTESNERDLVVYGMAASVLDDIVSEFSAISSYYINFRRNNSPEHPEVVRYHINLAHRICELASQGVPEELSRLQEPLFVHPSTENILDEHVVACKIEIESASGSTGTDRASTWKKVSEEVLKLKKNYAAQIQALFSPGSLGKRTANLSGECALHKVSLKCYLGAARSVSPVWDAAVALCHLAKCTWYRKDAVAAVERHIQLAEAHLAQDDELADRCVEASFVAEQIFLMLEDASMQERRVYDSMLKVADQRVLALLARRKGQEELCRIHEEIAGLEEQIAQSWQDKSSRGSVRWQSAMMCKGRLEAAAMELSNSKSQQFVPLVSVSVAFDPPPDLSAAHSKEHLHLHATPVSALL